MRGRLTAGRLFAGRLFAPVNSPVAPPVLVPATASSAGGRRFPFRTPPKSRPDDDDALLVLLL